MRWTTEQLRKFLTKGQKATDAIEQILKDDESLESQLWRQLCNVQRKLHCSVLREHEFHPGRQWRFDFAVLTNDVRIAIELEGIIPAGGRHQRVAGFSEDARKYANAAAHGWIVLRFVPDQIKTGEAIETIVRVIQFWTKGQPS